MRKRVTVVNPQAHMHERDTVVNPQRTCARGYSSHFVCHSVTLALCHSVCHFFIFEKVPFSGFKLTSVHSR